MRRVLIVCAFIGCAQAADLRYWIEPCTKPETGCKPQDVQMAQWALEDWQRVSGGKLHLEKTDQRLRANIRVFWTSPDRGVYGEARRFEEDGIQGSEVHVLADLSGSDPGISGAAEKDPLLRDAIVFLTCLHETGHALGLAHTDVFADIMYSFYYGGDIPEYFGRYRRRLKTREDITKNSAISDNDRKRLIEALLPPGAATGSPRK